MLDVTKLTDRELEDLVRLQYERHETSKTLTGSGLVELHHRATWAKKYKSFGLYVNEVLGVSKQTAYRLMGTVDKTIGQYKNADIDTENAESVPNGTESAKSGQKSTSAEYGMADPKPEQPTITVYKDQEGRQIEGQMAEFFLEQDHKIKEWAAAIKNLKALILSDIECDPVWAGFNVSHFEVHIKNIKEMIKFNRPWAQCPVCSGDGGIKGGCKTCKDPAPIDPKAPVAKKGRGWLIHNQWRCIPEDEK